MIDIFVKILNYRIIDQLKIKFAAIDAEKRRIHLRHLLTQAEIERKLDFFVASVRRIETKRIRNNFEQQTALSLKKKSKLKSRKFILKTVKSFSINTCENVLMNLILN